MSTPPAWECQHSVDVDVPQSFAWQYMSDIRNWNDPPAEFSLEGPFAAGTQGWTRMPGQPAHSWELRDVEPERGYTIGGSSLLQGADLLVQWQFDALAHGRTRITQRMELSGENATSYVNDLKAAFEPNLEPGMLRIARMMTEAAQTARPSGQ